ncbi:MAG TPA: hypothetical protein VEA15_07905, partial [Caulobacteraceae bacterium]|nr:hypothetical protein [Caulobacteraceae bacterium]
YQINDATYRDMSNLIGLDDFSPTTQDAMAVAKMRYRSDALTPLLQGDVDTFLEHASQAWASSQERKRPCPRTGRRALRRAERQTPR